MREKNFYVFTEQLKEYLKQEFEDGVRIDIHQTVKNNGVRYYALTILEDENNVAPNISLDEWYFAYLLGNSMEWVVENILRLYDNGIKDRVDVSFFEDFEKAKSRILFKVVGAEKNKERMQTMPHVEFLDLALAFYYYVEESETENGSIQINNDHLEMWKVSAGEIYDLAMKNTERLMPVKLERIDKLIGQLLKQEGQELPADAAAQLKQNADTNPMYVMSNRRNYFGAAALCYPDSLKNIARSFCTDLIVLPSSVHEVIVLPAFDEGYYERINAIIADINEHQVKKEEVLSDHFYYYDRERDELRMPPVF